MEYNLEEDHKAIKAKIKEWELAIDTIVECLQDGDVSEHYDCVSDLDEISNEMMAINL